MVHSSALVLEDSEPFWLASTCSLVMSPVIISIFLSMTGRCRFGDCDKVAYGQRFPLSP